MTSSDDMTRMILRNKLLGKWAAEKLGMAGREAEAYSESLADGALDPGGGDVFTKIRRDFDGAGVTQSDEDILRVMTDLMLRAGNLISGSQGHSADAQAVLLARNLMSR
jgi:hypothetical protein